MADTLRSLEKVNRELEENSKLITSCKETLTQTKTKRTEIALKIKELKADLELYKKVDFPDLKIKLKSFQDENNLPITFLEAGYVALKTLQKENTLSIGFKITTLDQEYCNLQNNIIDLEKSLKDLEHLQIKLTKHKGYLIRLADELVNKMETQHARTEKTLIKAYNSLQANQSTQTAS